MQCPVAYQVALLPSCARVERHDLRQLQFENNFMKWDACAVHQAMKYIPILDGLRAVAILIVLVSHVVTPWVPGGFGVTLFFFISGFIITRMMLAEPHNGVAMAQFYVRRMFRLYPALLLLLLTACGLALWMGSAIPRSDVLAVLLYFANYHEFHPLPAANSPLVITWSLAVEEHFYMVYPALMMLAGRRLLNVLLVVIVLTLAWRGYLVFELNVDHYRTYLSTDTRIDSIAWGCLLAVLAGSKGGGLERLRKMPLFYLGGALVLATFVIRSEAFRETLRYSLQGLGLFMVLCELVVFQTGPNLVRQFLESPPMRWIGRISYSLYLFHFLILTTFDNLGWTSPWARVAVLTMSFVVAELSCRLVETPCRKFGHELALKIGR